MAQPAKTVEQIAAMREGGAILAQILADVRAYVAPDMNGYDIDRFAEKKIKEYGATPTYKSSEVNFPGSICISLNDEIVHGVPTGSVLEKGDLVSFDLVITYKGMKTDSAFTMVVGAQPKGAIKHLINYTERSLFAGIDAISGPCHTGDIGAAVEKVLTTARLGIVRDLVGHGVGLQMHMSPEVPNYGRPGSGVLLSVGDTIAIEPMATLGGEKVMTDGDNWTIRTRDGSLAAHFEHTVLITETGADVLTRI